MKEFEKLLVRSLSNPGDRRVVIEYLQNFMLKNKRMDYILMPFFPE